MHSYETPTSSLCRSRASIRTTAPKLWRRQKPPGQSVIARSEATKQYTSPAPERFALLAMTTI